MRTFLNHIKNETLDEIKTSLENLWQQMIKLSEFFQCSFVLILKRKCLVRASRVRSGESGTPSTIIYVRWSSRRYELGCDTPVHLIKQARCWNWSVSKYMALSWRRTNFTHTAITEKFYGYLFICDYNIFCVIGDKGDGDLPQKFMGPKAVTHFIIISGNMKCHHALTNM